MQKKGITFAIPVKDPKNVLKWYCNKLKIDMVQEIYDMYEIEIINNVWLQFFEYVDKCEGIHIRIGVSNIEKISELLIEDYPDLKINVSPFGGRFLYSILDPWGNYLGFYEI